MSICEDRITEDSTEFEKAFLKIYDGNLWTALDKMKDWQPPKPLVVVPQIVADYIETQKGNDFDRVGTLVCGHFGTLVYGHHAADDRSEKHSELHKWITDNFDTFLEAIVNGYTVEKEQIFYLKNKNTGHILYRQPKEAGGDLIEVVATINEEYTWFTQDEIDTMHTGSYEQIAVKVDEVEP